MRQFGKFAERWFDEAHLAESTRIQRRRVYELDIKPFVARRDIECIDADEIRAICERVKTRGAPATALHVLDIFKGVYSFARRKGYVRVNPAAAIPCRTIAVLQPRDHHLSPDEIGIVWRLLESAPVREEYRFAMKLILLTLVRRSELVLAKWHEIDFAEGIWTMPAGRAKFTKPRCVYLSRQALDVLVELKARSGASEYVLPSMLDAFVPMSPIRLNCTTSVLFKEAQKLKLPLQRFSLYDLRRTGEAMLKAAGFSPDWIDLALARESIERVRGLGDRTVYATQLRHMLQEWADMVDAWASGQEHTPDLLLTPMRNTTVQVMS